METAIQDTLKRTLENLRVSVGLQSKQDIRICLFCKKTYDYNYIYYAETFNGNSYINNYCSEECCKNDQKKWATENIISVMQGAGIPSRFLELETEKGKTLQEVIKNSPRGIYCWGGAGTGKTIFVCSVARELLKDLKSVHFVSSPDMTMNLQDKYKKEGESAYDFLKIIAKKEVLIIDDLGAEKTTEFIKQAFYFLINEREQWQRQTIITSNYPLSTLNQQIDERVSSRISGMCDVLQFTGKDMRIKK